MRIVTFLSKDQTKICLILINKMQNKIVYDLEHLDRGVFLQMLEKEEIDDEKIMELCSLSKTMMDLCDRKDYEIFRMLLIKRYNVNLADVEYVRPDINPRQLFGLMRTTLFDQINERVFRYINIPGNTRLNLAIPDVIINKFAQQFNISTEELLELDAFQSVIATNHCNLYKKNDDMIYAVFETVPYDYEYELPYQVDGISCVLATKYEGWEWYLMYGIIMTEDELKTIKMELTYAINSKANSYLDAIERWKI